VSAHEGVLTCDCRRLAVSGHANGHWLCYSDRSLQRGLPDLEAFAAFALTIVLTGKGTVFAVEAAFPAGQLVWTWR
jgi:hypothetical protein